MEKINYASIANKLLGNELYLKLITAIAKEHNNTNLVEYGKKVVEKCCEIIVMIGMSNKLKMDTVKLCLEKETIEISCKEFAKKYEEYIQGI